MKKFICFLLTIFDTAQMAKADTSDFWHVYYNETVIQECNQFSGGQTITIRSDSIKRNDSITVKYFHDFWCFDCPTFLIVKNEMQEIILLSKSKGTFKPVSFALHDLAAFMQQYSNNSFEVFYYEGEIRDMADGILLFRIKLE